VIEVSIANLISLAPEVANARYDFKTGTFRTGEGKLVTDGVLDGWGLVSERNRAPSTGRATLKRGILLNSLARSESQDRPGLLERALRQSRQLVKGGGLARTFYMREDAAPVATLTGNELGAWEDIRQLGKKAEARYRDNLAGTTAIKADTGWEIVFAGSGAKKTVNGKGDTLLRIVPALRSIVENGVLIASIGDNKSRTGIEAVHTFSASVDLGGSVRDVVVQVRQGTDGKHYYNLSRDMSDGARFMVPEDVGTSEGIAANGQRPLPALEGNPAGINIEFSPSGDKAPAGWGAVEAAAPITDDAIREITKDMNAELARTGLAGKVSVRVVRKLISHVSGNAIAGRFDAAS
jgi:hypothetical protein